MSERQAVTEMGSVAAARWSDERLIEARYQADPPVDDLVEKLLSDTGDYSAIGRSGYNRLLDLLNEMVAEEGSPFSDASIVEGPLADYPGELLDYFRPTAAPEWVDPAKLEVAGELWHQNKLAVIAALYCISLPSCYLLKNGIPALYESDKLTDPTHIYQRIYETGRFLDAVMSPGGLSIGSQRGTAWPSSPAGSPVQPQALDETGTTPSENPSPERFIWGPGFVSARKVRFLHAAMRYLLTHRDGTSDSGGIHAIAAGATSEERHWDTVKLGKPVNQEDLAYTLLTFGYLIPVALDRWGCRWTLDQREAFLHLWKTVGHTMGVREGLLTDKCDQAEQLFNLIRDQQSAPSMEGEVLAGALMDFLKDYLPGMLGIDRHVPPLLIKKQIGEIYSSMIFTDKRERDARRLRTRVIFFLGLILIRGYYSVRNRVFYRVPGAAMLMGNIFAEAGEELINSWRGAYERRAFYVPENAQTWRRRTGSSSPEFINRTLAWRQKVFNTLFAGVGLLMVSPLFLIAATVMFVLGHPVIALIPGLILVVNVATAIFFLTYLLPALSKSRPKVTEYIPAGRR